MSRTKVQLVSDIVGNVSGGASFTGIVTATKFIGDISEATGAAAGLGTALSQVQSSPLNKIYFTNQVLSIGSTITVDPPDSSNVAYTQYAEIAVEQGYDLIIEDGDDLVPDILGLSTVTATPLSGAGGRVRADQFTNKAGTGAPTFPNGVQVTGVSTLGNTIVGGGTTQLVVTGNARITGILTIGTSSITLDGFNNQVNVGTAVTINSSGVTVTGVVTATTFSGDLTGNATGLSGTPNITVGTIGATSLNASGVVTATSFSGSGANLTGIAATTDVRTNSLVVSGVSTVAAGSSAAPSITPTGDTDTGIFFPSADTIAFAEGGSEAARIDSSGRLLVGTSTAPSSSEPQYAKLVVSGSTNGPTDYGRLALVRGEDSASMANNSGVGKITFSDNGGDQFGVIACEVDGTTSASGDAPGRLVFSTTADGASSPTERMRITSSGSLIQGTVVSTNGVGYNTTNSGVEIGSGGVSHQVPNNSASGAYFEAFFRGASLIGSITQSGTTTVQFNTSSDYRLKENVVPVEDGIDRLMQLKPSRFNFISEPDRIVDGFLAHEAQAIVPECVSGEKDAVDDDGNPKYQGIDHSKLVPLLTAALQEAIGRIEALEAEVAALKAQ